MPPNFPLRQKPNFGMLCPTYFFVLKSIHSIHQTPHHVTLLTSNPGFGKTPNLRILIAKRYFFCKKW
jgi:hypothetical protein